VDAVRAGIPVKLFTYNKPETGNIEWARYVEATLGERNIKRMVNKNDGVSGFLSRVFFFRKKKWAHAGGEIFYHGQDIDLHKLIDQSKKTVTGAPSPPISGAGNLVPEIILDEAWGSPMARELGGLKPGDIAIFPVGSKFGNSQFRFFNLRFASKPPFLGLFGTSYPGFHRFFGDIRISCRATVAAAAKAAQPKMGFLAKLKDRWLAGWLVKALAGWSVR
jgi:hypothetical protein